MLPAPCSSRLRLTSTLLLIGVLPASQWLLAAPVATVGVPTSSVVAGAAVTPFTPVTASGGTAPYAFSIAPALPAGLLFDPATGQVSGTPAASAAVPLFAGGDDFNAATTAKWAYFYRLLGSGTGNGLLQTTAGTGRLDFTKAGGDGSYFLGWDGTPAASGSRSTASYATSWRADLTVTNAAPTETGKFASVGLQVSTGPAGWAAVMVTTGPGAVSFRAEGTGLPAAVTSSLTSGVAVRLRLTWDAVTKVLTGWYSTDGGTSYTPATTFPVEAAWAAGAAPAGFNFELFGNSNLTGGIGAGTVYGDDFAVQPTSVATAVHTVTVTDAVPESASGSFVLAVNPAAPSPILIQPVATAVIPGGGLLTLRVVPANPTGNTVQWHRNGQPLAGATDALLALPGFTAAMAGSYTVTVNGTTSTATAVTLAPPGGASVSDPGFARPDFKQDTWAGRVAVDTNGRVYASWVNGSALTGVGGRQRGAVIRLGANGALDPSFSLGDELADALAVAVQPDGRVLVGGLDRRETDETGFALYRVFRFNADGTRDPSYRSPVFAGLPRFMTLQPDGRLLVVPAANNAANGGIPTLARLQADGALDSTLVAPALSANGVIFAPPVVDSAGRIYIGGIFSSLNGSPRPGVARLLSNGAPDATWVPSGFALAGNGQIRGLALQTQGANAGKLLVAGGSLTVASSAAPTANRPVLRLNSDGSLDPSFTLVSQADAGMSVRPRLLEVLPDDRFYIVGSALARFLPNGSLDPDYTRPAFTLDSAPAEAFWMAALADGRVVVPPEAGLSVNGNPAPSLVRFTATGAPDPAFNAGVFQREVYPGRFQVLPDGKLLAFGAFNRVGGIQRPGIARLHADGTLDGTFQVALPNLAYVAMAEVTSDGRILAATRSGPPGGTLASGLVRLTSTGALDPSFSLDSSLATNTTGLEFRRLADDKVTVWSLTPQGLISGRNFLQRLGPTGTIDATFVPAGMGEFGAVYRGAGNALASITVGGFRVLAEDAAGRLIVRATTGTYPAGATSLQHTLLRIATDGNVDPSFAAPVLTWATQLSFPLVTDAQTNNGNPSQVPTTMPDGYPFSGVLPLADGRLLVYGLFKTLHGQPAPGLARLTATGALDPAFAAGSGAELRFQPGRTAQVQQVALAGDGKLWVSGAFDTFNGVAAPGLVRLHADGAVDLTFASDLAHRTYLGGITQVSFGAGGRVYVGGTYARGGDPFPSALHALTAPPAPLIVTPPAPEQVVAVSGTAVWRVGASGGGPLAYQWRKDGTPLPGATGASLTLTPVAPGDAGTYDVVVTGAGGSVTSPAAGLTVNPTIGIFDPPFARRATAGSRVQFRVSATTTLSGATLTYQWRKNGDPISGATAADLTLATVGAGDAASYSVLVGDGTNAVASAAAALTVLPVEPVLWQQFSEFATEHAPARTIHDGAGRFYVPWTVTDRNPDVAAGRAVGVLARFHEADGAYDPTFRLDRRYRRADHVALLPDGRLLVSVIVGEATTVIRVGSDGAEDPTFQAPNFARGIRFITRQPDGKVLVAAVGAVDPRAPAGAVGLAAPAVYRLSADGALDPGFPAAVFNASGILFGPPVVDAGGRIYLAGGFSSVNGTARINLARLLPDGTLDATFAAPASLPAGFTSTQARSLAFQSGGRVIVAGDFVHTARGANNNRIMAIRFGADGAFDDTFAQPLQSELGIAGGGALRLRHLEILPDDRIVAVSDRLVRLNANGTRDTTFLSRPFARETFWLSRGADGRYYVPDLGGVTGAGGTLLPLWGNGIGRFSADGAPDFTLQLGGWGRSAVPGSGAVLSDGRVWVGGAFNRFGAAAVPGLAQFVSPTALSGTQVTAARTMSSAFVTAADNDRIFAVAGTPSNTTETATGSLVRIKADGTADATFVPVLPAGYSLASADLLGAPGGKLLVWQEAIAAQAILSGASGENLLRLNADGSRDNGFTSSLASFAVVERGANNVVTMIRTGGFGVGDVLADGRILAGGAAIDGNVRLVRLLPDGSNDPSFNSISFGTALAVSGFTTGGLTDPVTNTTGQFPITTYNADSVLSAARQAPDGKVYAGGRFALPGSPRGLVRLLATGALDPAFTGAGIGYARSDAAPAVLALAFDAAGRLYVGGRFDSYNGVAVPGLFRLRADGTFDAGWASPLTVTDAPRATVELKPVGDKLYAFGTVVRAGDILPTPYAVADIPPPPTIQTAPLAATVLAGGETTFSVVATGVGPLSYQWYKDGTVLPGATNAALTVTGATANAGGAYTVAITGAGGTTVTAPVTLAVILPPVIVTPPRSQAVSEGQPLVLRVGLTGTAPFTYQWRKSSGPIGGATNATLSLAAVAPADAGDYDVVVTNPAGSATSAVAAVAVISAGTTATQAVVGVGYVAGGTVTITNTLTYAGTTAALGWEVLLPPGWSLASSGSGAGETRPTPGTTDLLEWAWTTIPPSPVTFTYTLNVPPSTTGEHAIAALLLVRPGGAPVLVLAKPDPLLVPLAPHHSADTDRNFRINLFELTRVIELFNTRNGTNRTGSYRVDAAGEDGFNPEPARAANATVTLSRYHSSDTNRDGKLSLFELTRVIELFNTRAGTNRTGQYRVEAGTEDGYAPSP